MRTARGGQQQGAAGCGGGWSVELPIAAVIARVRAGAGGGDGAFACGGAPDAAQLAAAATTARSAVAVGGANGARPRAGGGARGGLASHCGQAETRAGLQSRGALAGRSGIRPNSRSGLFSRDESAYGTRAALATADADADVRRMVWVWRPPESPSPGSPRWPVASSRAATYFDLSAGQSQLARFPLQPPARGDDGGGRGRFCLVTSPISPL